MKIDNRQTLDRIKKEAKEAFDSSKCRILICAGTGCMAGGSGEIYERLSKLVGENPNIEIEFGKEIAHRDGPISVNRSGCHGFCEMGPLVRIEPLGLLYTKVKPEDADEIFEKTIKKGEIIERLLYELDGKRYQKQEEIPFYEGQKRVVLENCGHIDVEHLEDYIAHDGYQALAKALFDMTPEEVLTEVDNSGLRGRGGAGFPTGFKWKQVVIQEEKERYVVCNGDEGDPGAFMDRSVMEGDPHKMIEGMMLCAYAVGAQEGYIYVRAEYPLAISRLRLAISQAEEAGLLGDNILGSGFSFRLHISRGAGAFVCGEGTALITSIESNRGMPRCKPPFSAEKGLFAKPTTINNVETFANLPGIIRNGYKWFRDIGTDGSPGTKAFALTGCVKNTGLIEVPMGTTLRKIIFDIGGGMKNNSSFKAVQIGGPSGGCLVEKHLDEVLDFDSVKKFNTIMGSGGLVVMDDTTCMVDVAKFFMSFTQRESCGKCSPCRIGTTRMLEILERICDGKGKPEDIDTLIETAEFVKARSLCGLGKSAPLPVLNTIANFRNEYDEHILEHKCRAHVCPAFREYSIDSEKCKGCGKCARNCPADAITGEKKKPHKIDSSKCIKCGTCMDNCPFEAIVVE